MYWYVKVLEGPEKLLGNDKVLEGPFFAWRMGGNDHIRKLTPTREHFAQRMGSNDQIMNKGQRDRIE